MFFYMQFTALVRPRALVPAQMTVLLIGLFFATDVIAYLSQGLILDVVSVSHAGAAVDLADMLGAAGIGMLGANMFNNLPAYLAFEPLAAAGAGGSSSLLMALLVGVNIGSIITPWASLATLLWYERLVAEGVHISWSRFIRRGLILAPCAVVAATLGLYYAL